MAYEKQQWDTTSYINPTRMNHIEDGIKANSNEIESVANNVIAYGECTTARSTSAKVVSCSGFVLKKGSRIAIRFTDTGNSNPSSGNLTLNVNETGVKTIVDGHANKTILTYANGSYFYNNLVAEFVYDGTYWVYMNRDANTTYTGATLKTGAAKTGSGTTVTDTIAKSTTIDNAIQTLLNNDVAINSNLTEIESVEKSTFSSVLGSSCYTLSYNSIKKKNSIVNFQCNLSMLEQVNSGNYPLTIPTAFRPSEARIYDVKCSSDASKSIFCIIGTDGKVVIYGNLLANYSYFISGEYIQG